MINLFIGSNNQTKEVEKDKILNILDKYCEGYTIVDSLGYWKGQVENSCIVMIQQENIKIYELIEILKKELKQDAIGYQILPALLFA